MLPFKSKEELEKAVEAGALVQIEYSDGSIRHSGILTVEGIWQATVEVKDAKIVKVF